MTRRLAATTALLLLAVGCGGSGHPDAADSRKADRNAAGRDGEGRKDADALVAHEPPTRFAPSVPFSVNPSGLDAVTLDGTKAYTFGSEGGSLIAVDLASSQTIGTAEPEGSLPEGYLPAMRNPPRDLSPSCEQRGPAVATVGGKKVALGLFPVVEQGSGTNPDTAAIEMVALDTDSGKTAWRARLDIRQAHTTCHVAGVSGHTAVLVLGGDRAVGVSHTTYGVDLTTGKVVWEQENFEAQLVQDGHAVGGTENDDGWVVLASHEAEHGKWQWTSSPAADIQIDASVFSPGRLLVKTIMMGAADTVVKLSDGSPQPVEGIGEEFAGVNRCLYDGQSLTFCHMGTDDEAELVAYDANGKRQWRVGGPSDDSGRIAPFLTAAYHGLVYGAVERDNRPSQPIVLDGRTGSDRELSPGATPWLVNAYVGLDDERGSVTVHHSTG